jgi:hypothetical protein
LLLRLLLQFQALSPRGRKRRGKHMLPEHATNNA